MAQVHIDGADLVVEVEGLDKLWALRSRLAVPLARVRGATADPGAAKEFAGAESVRHPDPRSDHRRYLLRAR